MPTLSTRELPSSPPPFLQFRSLTWISISIDSGINIAHVELEGRARWGKTIPKDADEDSNGHGSHVAGTIASAKYGVAKRANLVAVKVLGAGGSGTMSDVVAGVAWAADSAYAAAAAAAKERNPKHKGSVASALFFFSISPAKY